MHDRIPSHNYVVFLRIMRFPDGLVTVLRIIRIDIVLIFIMYYVLSYPDPYVGRRRAHPMHCPGSARHIARMRMERSDKGKRHDLPEARLG